MTHEEMQGELTRMEADIIDLSGLAHETAHSLNRLTGVVARLAESQQQAWQAIDRTSESQQQAWQAIDRLAKRIDRFIASQGNGPHDGD